MADNDLIITLSGVGKKYRRWVFKHIDFQFSSSSSYGIAGRNGTGKSTLMRIISGFLTPSRGTVTYQDGASSIALENFGTRVSFVAPYISIIEELTVEEQIKFHFRFQEVRSQTNTSILEMVKLNEHGRTLVSDLSSGMMQRLKLGLALVSDTPVLLLDEPTSYLDRENREWFHTMINQHRDNRLVIIASNDAEDLELCEEIIDVESFQ